MTDSTRIDLAAALRSLAARLEGDDRRIVEAASVLCDRVEAMMDSSDDCFPGLREALSPSL